MQVPAPPASNPPPLRLRDSLRASLRESGGTPYYQVEDPIKARFFRLGVTEWEFASRLDGRLTPSQVLKSVNQHSTSDDETLTAEAAEVLCRWLIQNGLIESASLPEEVRSNVGRTPQQTLNPFFIKVPLIHPDGWVAWMLPWLRPLLSLPAFLAWCGLIIAGVYSIASHWDRFVSSAAAYLSPKTWMCLWLVWILLKIVHESFHGLVCRKYGGYLGSAGLLLILFSPVAFVDVTSSWRFRSRWQRIFTAAAGMYAEFAIAAAAAILWANTETGLLNFVCHSVITTASVVTILFNANPLMRFDGYYILSDLLDFQNLAMAGRKFAVGIAGRIFLGRPVPPVRDTGWRAVLIAIYGVLALFWKFLVSVSLILAAAVLFHGAGLILAAFAVVCWFAKPAFLFGINLLSNGGIAAPTLRRLVTAVGVVFVLGFAVVLLPWPGGVVAPAIVQYAPLETVRTAADGFVKSIEIEPGQQVQAGDVLIRLTNDKLRVDWLSAKFALQAAQIDARQLHRDGMLAAYQAELENLRALREKEETLREKADELVVRAPIAGSVLTSRLADLQGKYVEVGTTLLTIGNESHKEIQIAIAEEYVDVFSHKVGSSPRLRMCGRPLSRDGAILSRVEPGASLTLRHAAWGGNNGGPLPVQPVSDSRQERYQLVSPRFHGTIALSPEIADSILAGQMGEARYWDWTESIGRRLHRTTVQWVRGKLGRAANRSS